jgi:hypothetical protein
MNFERDLQTIGSELEEQDTYMQLILGCSDVPRIATSTLSFQLMLAPASGS